MPCDGGVNVRWERRKDVRVLSDQPIERRAPRRECHRVEERESPERASVQQRRSERDRPADVVGHDGRGVQCPAIQHLAQDLPLRCERDVLILVFLGGAEARQVKDVDGPAPAHRCGDLPPDERRPRCAMDKYDRRPGPELLPRHHALPRLLSPAERPIGHWCRFLRSVARFDLHLVIESPLRECETVSGELA